MDVPIVTLALISKPYDTLKYESSVVITRVRLITQRMLHIAWPMFNICHRNVPHIWNSDDSIWNTVLKARTNPDRHFNTFGLVILERVQILTSIQRQVSHVCHILHRTSLIWILYWLHFLSRNCFPDMGAMLNRIRVLTPFVIWGGKVIHQWSICYFIFCDLINQKWPITPVVPYVTRILFLVYRNCSV